MKKIFLILPFLFFITPALAQLKAPDSFGVENSNMRNSSGGNSVTGTASTIDNISSTTPKSSPIQPQTINYEASDESLNKVNKDKKAKKLGKKTS